MLDIQRRETTARMSQIVIHNQTAYMAGVVANDLHADITEQTAQALTEIDRLLADAGSNKHRLLSAQIWMRELERDFNALNAVWEKWLLPNTAPTRATCQTSMAAPGILVEIIVPAAISGFEKLPAN